MITELSAKPLGHRSYGSIPHLPTSRLGPADHCCSPGQAKIATEKARDKHDTIIVQEKLDGSNVGIARIGNEIYAVTRAGYLATTSPFKQHHIFDEWVQPRKGLFLELLQDGERLCGEWLACAHGTMYDLTNLSPFAAFDIMEGKQRATYQEFRERLEDTDLDIAPLLSIGPPRSIDYVMEQLDARKADGTYGNYGAREFVEGAVWRVERKGKVDFIVKYVRPDKVDGKYLGDVDVWNTFTLE